MIIAVFRTRKQKMMSFDLIRGLNGDSNKGTQMSVK